jgi:hypothetical protein
VASEEADLVGEVAAHTVLPLHRNLQACGDASNTSESERGEVLEDKELVYMCECFLPFVCHL